MSCDLGHRLAAQAMAELDRVRAAADAGTVRAEHVAVFGQGIAMIGAQQMRQAQEMLLPVPHLRAQRARVERARMP